MNKELEEAIKYLKLYTKYNEIVYRGQWIRIPEKNFTKTKDEIETKIYTKEK